MTNIYINKLSCTALFLSAVTLAITTPLIASPISEEEAATSSSTSGPSAAGDQPFPF